MTRTAKGVGEIALLEPPRTPGFLSGGYRYQDEVGARLAAGKKGTRTAVPPAELSATVVKLQADGAHVVLDGLYAASMAEPPSGCTLLLHVKPDSKLLKGWLPNVAAVIVTGEPAALAVAAAGGPPPVIVRPGLDACFVPGKAPANPSPVVLCVGTVTEAKGQKLIAAAIAAEKELAKGVVLRCIGDVAKDPKYVDALKKAAAKADLTLELLGTLATEEISDHLRKADVFVSASASESFGMAAAEACACAVPVVAFATGEVDHFLRDGENGLLVPAGDEKALGKAVRALLGNADLRTRLRRPDLRPKLGTWDDVAKAFVSACSR